jgi:fructosamine-3-kinase
MSEGFVKTQPGAEPDFFRAEARGLELLRVPGGPPLPAVREVAADRVVIDRVDAARAAEPAAREFGRRLATMHTTWLPCFGAAAPGFIGALPLDNTPADDWPTFYAVRRLLPYLPGLRHDVCAAVERVVERLPGLAGPAEPPARIHGDLWSGNLLWATDGQVWLVDAASAHGGHRETDLAMLALFGAPHLDVIVASYQEVAPLPDGWRDRIPLHQLHPLLVHAQMFGGHYGDSVIRAAEAVCH